MINREHAILKIVGRKIISKVRRINLVGGVSDEISWCNMKMCVVEMAIVLFGCGEGQGWCVEKNLMKKDCWFKRVSETLCLWEAFGGYGIDILVEVVIEITFETG